MRAPLLLTCLIATLAAPAWGKTQRFAIVVGHNTGAQQRPPLRYAHSDAGKMARALSEVADVAPHDVLLLHAPTLAQVEAAFAQVRERAAKAQAAPEGRSVVVFYFSGHGDGEGLELGQQKLSFAQLKALLSGTGATVRLSVIDACQSGAALRDKGGKPAPGFAIRIQDQLSARGEVFITSAAADEAALESSEVKGSLFTHFFVSGLRGAADASGDGQVTLAEVYRFAHERTVAASAAVSSTPQHPSYDYQLAGSGELVLASLQTPTALLQLPDGMDRALIFDLVRDQVIAEVAPGARRDVVLAAGEYGVRVVRGGESFGGRYRLVDGTRQQVRWEDLTRVELAVATPKGEGVQAQVERGHLLGVTVGGARPIADGVGLQAAARIFYEPTHSSGPSFGLFAATGAGMAPQFRENSVQLRAGYRAAFTPGPFVISVGAEAGPAVFWQQAEGGAPNWSLAAVLGPRAAGRLRVSDSAWVTLEAEFPLAFLRVDDAIRAAVLPSVTMGVALSL